MHAAESNLYPGMGIKHELREGTADEWLIIQDVAEGNIVGRSLPQFLKAVFTSQELLRLHSTIKAQVEGVLSFRLRGRGDVLPTRQHTQALKEDILLAAERTKVNRQSLYDLPRNLKTISYNLVAKSIQILFFDRATARKSQFTMVHFRASVYRLENMHVPTSGSAWERQSCDIRARERRSEGYVLRMYNVSRFVDIGKISAYISKHSPVPHNMEDMDSCTPNSRTSNVWKLTFRLEGCPHFLRG